jgi:hypothetical protein
LNFQVVDAVPVFPFHRIQRSEDEASGLVVVRNPNHWIVAERVVELFPLSSVAHIAQNGLRRLCAEVGCTVEDVRELLRSKHPSLEASGLADADGDRSVLFRDDIDDSYSEEVIAGGTAAGFIAAANFA